MHDATRSAADGSAMLTQGFHAGLGVCAAAGENVELQRRGFLGHQLLPQQGHVVFYKVVLCH